MPSDARRRLTGPRRWSRASAATSSGASCPWSSRPCGRCGVGAVGDPGPPHVWAVPAALASWCCWPGRAARCCAVLRHAADAGPGWRSRPLLIAVNWALFIWAVNTGRDAGGQPRLLHQPADQHGGRRAAVPRADRPDRARSPSAWPRSAWRSRPWPWATCRWISLALAFSFGSYGIVRKQVAVDAQTGLLVECLLLARAGLAYVALAAGARAQATSPRPRRPPLLAARAGPDHRRCRWRCSPGRRGACRCRPWASCSSSRPTISFVIGVVAGRALHAAAGRRPSCFIWGGAVFAFGAWRLSGRSRRPDHRSTLSSPHARG